MNIDLKEILKKPVRSINGVGEARARLLNKLNLYTVGDVINHFPREYEDRNSFKKIAQLMDGQSCSFEGIIASKVIESRLRAGLTIYKVLIKDDTGSITAIWFNQRYIKNVFKIGEEYVFYGRINRKSTNLSIQNPVYEIISGREMKNTCRIVPVYPSTCDLSQNTLRSVIRSALEMVLDNIEETLPEEVRNKYNLSEINYSISNIHFPKCDQDFINARKRLVFEELFLLQLGLLCIKGVLRYNKTGISFGKVDEMESFIESLPFKLTGAQKRVFEEIQRDMESIRVMNRLVQGDVGSGKTIVAVLSIYKAVKNGYQATLMVPTEILANQQYTSISRLLGKLGINVALLTGSQTARNKSAVLEGIKSGDIHVLIGTHALIEENVEFKRLGLVVTDEQHRFGVRQRAALAKKGENPDVIVMTATPIPRTLALILYGDLDISIIDELPPGRKLIETYAVDNSMRERINVFIRNKVMEGRQVYIVCPLVEESENIEAKSAQETAERIAEEDFKDLRVGMMHGKMKQKDKDEIMKSFIEGNIDILVSTTVIEVGVDVPNASVMIIENAERFGLAQLHQLRGRVGRGQHQSYCILYNESRTDVSKERMKVMQKTNDGFVISEKDLELRGPGEFFGTRQHGLPELRIANLYRDIEILKLSQEAANDILLEDKLLSLDKNLRLRDSIKEKFVGKLNDLSFV
jgi:ATP-dependent DNA helicase RecG